MKQRFARHGIGRTLSVLVLAQTSIINIINKSDYGSDAQLTNGRVNSDVYTYVENQQHRDMKGANAEAIVAAWNESWSRHGWTPHILTENTISSHPAFPSWNSTIHRLAALIASNRGHSGESNIIRFRRRGFMQFFAKSIAGDGVLTDTDVFNYGLTPKDVERAVGRAGLASDTVAVHDGRGCAVASSSKVAGAGKMFFYPEGLSTTGVRVSCGKLNNGITSGTGAAYAKLLEGFVKFFRDFPNSEAEEMKLMNILAKSGSVAPVLLGMSFRPAFGEPDCPWKYAKAIHMYGPGIKALRWNGICVCGGEREAKKCRLKVSTDMGPHWGSFYREQYSKDQGNAFCTAVDDGKRPAVLSMLRPPQGR